MLLVERTKENPESFEDWWLLARSYATMGDYASAAGAYRQAAILSADDPAVQLAYAEALTLANGNKVPTAAKLIFAQVRQQTNDPRARYYLALAKAQAQNFQGALEDWLLLLRDSSPEAPWTPLVRRDIVNMVRFLELDLRAVLPDATEAELAKAGTAVGAVAEPATEMAALETRLSQDPTDWQGWISLARLRSRQGNDDDALAAINAGRSHYAAAPFVLAKLDEAAGALGLEDAETAPGPSDADVAASADMSEAERQAMIRGMVEGLAARLEERPDDLQGWLMLIRSYAVLQDPTAARAAVRKAKSVFRGTPAEHRRITRLADDLGVAQE
jgi:cytochrome c-type biogenesis protein CcmH